MSSIVTGILSSTVGLLWNKTRDWTAAKLNDGDITDAKIREIVVRELNDIKTKLDGLSRKDLLTSYRFFKEGVDLLSVCLDKSKLEQKVVTNPTQEDRGEASRMSNGVESDILNEALDLSHAMRKMKIYSDNELESAKERFKDARKKATEAFCNEALNIQDRIFAAKLRIVSEMLECLENPETAITGCLSFLQEVHSLPAVREIFSVYLNRGVKSLLNKAERVENVKSVMLINYVLFNLNLKFSPKLTDRVTLPGTRIELTDRCFNPIIDWQEVSSRKSMGEELSQLPNKVILDEAIYPYVCTMNSKGDVISGSCHDNNIKAISGTGEKIVVKLPDLTEGGVIDDFNEHIEGLTVDNNNNIYVVRWLKARTENGDVKSYMLNVLDENYNAKHVCRFDFLEARDIRPLVRIAINKNNNIIVIRSCDPHLYICDNTGELKHKFKRPSLSPCNLSISNKNEIIMSSDDHLSVHFYSEEGNLKSTIKVPEGHRVGSVAFHYVIYKIIVLTYVEENVFLLCYSETGELETSTFFCRSSYGSAYVTSHASGPVAVVSWKNITFI